MECGKTKNSGIGDSIQKYPREKRGTSNATMTFKGEAPPPFLPLEEANMTEEDEAKDRKHSRKGKDSSVSAKRIIGIFFGFLMLFLLYDAIFTPPEKRLIKPDASDQFLRWVQIHPLRGTVAFVVVIASAVILLLPVGTPLTIGCGFVYKAAYGWKLGFLIATVVSMFGSIVGAISCFLLGRYLMREHVRTWIRKYPLFVAIDIAAAEHGLKILAMLYLTPIAPLGPLSYMSGTTSMQLSHFALAKIASVPIMMLYVFIGASAGALVAASSRDSGRLEDSARKLEESPAFLLFGIIISAVMISVISVYIKQELFKILERQKKLTGDKGELAWESLSGDEADIEEAAIQGGNSPAPRQRHRHHSTESKTAMQALEVQGGKAV